MPPAVLIGFVAVRPRGRQRRACLVGRASLLGRRPCISDALGLVSRLWCLRVVSQPPSPGLSRSPDGGRGRHRGRRPRRRHSVLAPMGPPGNELLVCDASRLVRGSSIAERFPGGPYAQNVRPRRIATRPNRPRGRAIFISRGVESGPTKAPWSSAEPCSATVPGPLNRGPDRGRARCRTGAEVGASVVAAISVVCLDEGFGPFDAL
jgi:hypothetical protein